MPLTTRTNGDVIDAAFFNDIKDEFAGRGTGPLLTVAAPGAPTAIKERSDYNPNAGAVGAAINTAIADAGDNCGVQLTGGLVDIETPIILEGPSHFTFWGSGKGTRIRPHASFPNDRALIEVGYGDGVAADYTEVIDLGHFVLDGNSQAGTNIHGIRGGAFRMSIHDFEIWKTSGYGMRFESPNTSNKTDLKVSNFFLGRNRGGGVYCGAQAATDAHFQHFVAMYAGIGNTGQTIVNATANTFDIACASIQFSEFQTYFAAGYNFDFLTASANTRFTNGKIENGQTGGVRANTAGLSNVWFCGTGFRGGAGKLIEFDTSSAITCSFDGCWFVADDTAGHPTHFLFLDLTNASSDVRMTGGGMSESGTASTTFLAKTGSGSFRSLNVLGLADQDI